MQIAAFHRTGLSPSGVTVRTATRRVAALFITRFSLWRESQRERREISELGAIGRRELHALLLARGEGGLPEHLWPPGQRNADALACAASEHVHAVSKAHSAAILRSVSR